MKNIRGFAVAILLVAVMAPAAFGADFGVRAGRYNDGEEEFVGAEFAWNTGRLTFNPNIEYALTEDDSTLATGNFDVLYNFGSGTVRPYVGAGAGVSYFKVDTGFGDISETDTLVNAIGGVKFNLDFLTPYVQVKYFRLFDDFDSDDVALTVGLRF